jgi:pyroglutamyl-peptidase
MKVLVSGFEPYGEMSINPTQILAERAEGFDLEEVEVHSILLPVNYDECVERLLEEVERVSPDVVVSCGLYPGRTAVTPERVGVNAKDTMAEDPIPDNKGQSPVDEPVNPEGPDALFSLLPYRRIVDNLKAAGIPAFVSNSAGTYICNNTFYGLLDHVRRNGAPTTAGFVHFPASTEMAVERPAMPSLPLGMMAEALKIVIETAVEEARRQDAKAVPERSAS